MPAAPEESPDRCPVCGSAAGTFLSSPPEVKRCASCRLMFLASPPGAEEREALYQDEYYQPETGSRFFRPFEWVGHFFRRRRVRSILKREPGPASLLDVGCGRGIFMEMMGRRGWSASGTQLSQTAAEAARRRGLEVFIGELTDLEAEAGSFRVVTMFHLLEHIPRPGEYIEKAHRLLGEGGLLVVEVPDHGGPGFKILKQRHFCFDYPNHLVFFTRDSLERALALYGFRVEGRTAFSAEYSPFTTLQNLLNLLPGEPNRLYRSFMLNREGRRLRREPLTWFHALLAVPAAPVALALSLTALAFPPGNTLRVYARKTPAGDLGN